MRGEDQSAGPRRQSLEEGEWALRWDKRTALCHTSTDRPRFHPPLLILVPTGLAHFYWGHLLVEGMFGVKWASEVGGPIWGFASGGLLRLGRISSGYAYCIIPEYVVLHSLTNIW
jgi:hypothetical protein